MSTRFLRPLTLRSLFVGLSLMTCLGGGLALTTSAIAQVVDPPATPGQPLKPMRRGGERNLFQNLNLSPDQLQKIKASQATYKPQLDQQRQSLQQAQKDLRDLLANGSSTSDALRQKHTQVQNLRQQMANTQFESLLAIRAILTPEQRREFNDQMQQRMGNWKAHGGAARPMRMRSNQPIQPTQSTQSNP